MSSSGQLFLVVCLGILLLVAVSGISEFSDQAIATNANATAQIGQVDSTISPIFLVLSFIVVLGGGFVVLKAINLF
jgi:hypothetical protein